MTDTGLDQRLAIAGPARLSLLTAVGFSILAAALVLAPPVIYQTRNFFLGFHDVGNYTRAIYNFPEFGRFAVCSDGTRDFFLLQHFEPFFFLLVIPVRLFGTIGYVASVTAAMVLAAGYAFALGTAVGRSRWVGAACAAAYIANPYTYAITTYCHPEAFGLLFLLGFAYHAYVGQVRRGWLALVLALLVKEDMWVYAVVVAVLCSGPACPEKDRSRDGMAVSARARLKATALFVATAVCYYVVAVQLIGGALYPGAHYFNAFYESHGQPLTKVQIARGLLARWREFLPLLFTGAGFLFQLSFLFIGIFSGWRYVLLCGVALLWLTYPGGPPRSDFSLYYSYAALLTSIVVLPFALVRLRVLLAELGRRFRLGWGGRFGVPAVVALMLAVDLVMHLPGRVPWPIAESVDPASVFGRGPGVNVPVVRSLIRHFLTDDDGSVFAQFYTLAAIPQRRAMYHTLFDTRALLERRLQPKYVLLDLGADDPGATRQDLQEIVALLRRGGDYRPLYDDARVLLYRHQ